MAGVAHFTPEDLIGGLDLGDLFGDMGFGFGGGGIFDRVFRRRAAGAGQGRNIQISLEIDMDRIYRGGQEKVSVSHPSSCSHCHGYGTHDGNPPPVCPQCRGTGRRIVTRGGTKEQKSIQYQQITVCAECHGRGTQISQPCGECGGYGQIQKEESLKVTIPRGIEDGTVLRIPNHGLTGAPGSPAGDLHVAIYTRPDPRFQRRGPDLWRAEAISIADAALGTAREVATLDGRVQVKIPAGTQPDEILRVKGKGLPRFREKGRGDLFLRIQVEVPKKLTRQQRELFKQLRRLAA